MLAFSNRGPLPKLGECIQYFRSCHSFDLQHFSAVGFSNVGTSALPLSTKDSTLLYHV